MVKFASSLLSAFAVGAFCFGNGAAFAPVRSSSRAFVTEVQMVRKFQVEAQLQIPCQIRSSDSFCGLILRSSMESVLSLFTEVEVRLRIRKLDRNAMRRRSCRCGVGSLGFVDGRN